LGCIGPHQASRVDPNATRRCVAKATSSFARTAMAAVCVAGHLDVGRTFNVVSGASAQPSPPTCTLAVGGNIAGTTAKKRRHPSQSCDMQGAASWPHAAVLAPSKGRLTSATPASNEKPRRWERRPGQVFAERVVTGRTDGRCSAERNITTGAVRAVLICRL
jgi:hypothetical protein